ncbi:hypothetical protein EGI16_03380 [Chryseobacterium sp. G0240]|uniref:hypothetical protein n=1 Tax=Chryseobacterium sp. G0240 TaxID=2487066 RepID=UPI000F4552D7|nr:hypothetical protein [Chryseobacterium sp. G0240]ROI05441.1 hypothetical protein EGI16_03380 [Chryseobacterium sp. G0240]
MKLKILIIILLSSILLGCRTKHKASFYLKEGRTEIERITLDSVKEKTVKESSKKVTDQTVKLKKEGFSGDIIIRGKSDTLNPLIFHNVVSGDTLQSIVIRGTADYYINNHYRKTTENKKQSSGEEKTNFIQDLAKTAVSKETIKEVAAEVMQKTNDIKTKGFQAGMWIWLGVISVISIIIFAIYKYFKKKE